MIRVVLPLVVLAAAVYVFFWALDRRASKAPPPDRGGDSGMPAGPLGPDDDPDFLSDLEWDLERRRRHGQGEST